MNHVDFSRRQVLWAGLLLLGQLSRRAGAGMNVTLERSGGFANIPVHIAVDTAKLSPSESEQLQCWVDAADFFHLPFTLPSTAQPDRFQYQLTIDQGDRHHSVTMSETAVPDTLQPLIRWLLQQPR